ncbi:hypothetical protein M9Q43_13385 [Flavobacterium sp. HXWNR29]|uniref:hypothetical protein n=1 Tax=Flavobacterium odoriferum TaxID=2946604 RepID=UPI0021CB1C4D|nr:hypothetical protein [Flavobacterium sp. HXWNR29]MCU4190150.1 hypothetical protein [Flavobacterium sp. HXWNR29]
MNTINLKSQANGEINLKENTIEFNDKSSRMNKTLFKIFPFLFLIFGIYQLYSGIIAGREIQIILRILSGVLLLIIPVMFYHSNFIRTNKKIIELNEIKDVKMKKIFGEILIDFKLKDNSTRRVYNVKNMTDWNLVKTYLLEKNINCSN